MTYAELNEKLWKKLKYREGGTKKDQYGDIIQYPYYYLPAEVQTEKNKLSHRYKALKKFASWFKNKQG